MSGLQFGEQTREQFVPKYPSVQTRGQNMYKNRSIVTDKIKRRYKHIKKKIIGEANRIKFRCGIKFLRVDVLNISYR